MSIVAGEFAPLLRVNELSVRYRLRNGPAFDAVDRVGFEIARGETLALVGESGCGKSSVARAVMRLLPDVRGKIALQGIELTSIAPAELKLLRRHMQMIFQDPISSLNPKRQIKDILEAPLRIAGVYEKIAGANRIARMLELVGLDAKDVLKRYPHEFSGGQCQRISIARAIILEPELLICDEAVSALDVSVRAQVLNLLNRLRTELGLGMLFISHDLAVVRNVADRVAVMYLGRICEMGSADQIFTTPAHPYTRVLLAAVPVADPDHRRERVKLRSAEVPSPLAPPSGCRFHTRCPTAQSVCATTPPVLHESAPGQYVSCHFPLNASSVVKPLHKLHA